jgi:hypothetical protein
VGDEATVTAAKPAFYATGRGTGGWRDWLFVLHLPYTGWHLSYVAIGAAIAAPIRFDRLAESLAAFFLALGVGAHALDELHGHPLRTGIRGRWLATAGIAGVAGALALGWYAGGARLLPFMVFGAGIVGAYNLEWFRGRLHNAVTLAFAWGAFPLLTGYYAQHWTLSVGAALAAVGAFGLTLVQRTLSTPARWLRRSVREFDGVAELTDGGRVNVTAGDILRPLEQALKALSWAMVALAVGLVVGRR